MSRCIATYRIYDDQADFQKSILDCRWHDRRQLD